MQSPHINLLHFQVDTIDALQTFYGDLLGMNLRHHGDRFEFSFPNAETALSFSVNATTAYQYSGNDFYWKIGITLPDLDAAVQYLRKRGLQPSDPVQFRDIGYLSHLQDPCGFNIELLQQGFMGSTQEFIGGHPLAANATLAHLTLRARDLSSARQFFIERLGMQLISIQPVPDYHFCLYFFTWRDETPPSTDPTAVENREWLWRRPYLLVEIQHLLNNAPPLLRHTNNMCRFDGFSYSSASAAHTQTVTMDDLAVID